MIKQIYIPLFMLVFSSCAVFQPNKNTNLGTGDLKININLSSTQIHVMSTSVRTPYYVRLKGKRKKYSLKSNNGYIEIDSIQEGTYELIVHSHKEGRHQYAQQVSSIISIGKDSVYYLPIQLGMSNNSMNIFQTSRSLEKETGSISGSFDFLKIRKFCECPFKLVKRNWHDTDQTINYSRIKVLDAKEEYITRTFSDSLGSFTINQLKSGFYSVEGSNLMNSKKTSEVSSTFVNLLVLPNKISIVNFDNHFEWSSAYSLMKIHSTEKNNYKWNPKFQ